MKRWLQGAAALAIATAGPLAFAADHLDSPGAVPGEADITDVYAWMESESLVLVMNVGPLAGDDAKFSDAIQYALHLESSPGYGQAGEKTNVICTFAEDQKISCWVGEDDYVTGDASSTQGIKSESGKTRVFAGLRADPFFFNLEGFKDAVSTAVDASGALVFDGTGCPAIDPNTATILIGMLQGTAKGQGAAADFFATANVLSIVLEIDKTLVNKGGKVISVWGSTHTAGG